MMNKPPESTPDFCDKARELAIAALEGDVLSELDSAFMEKHLEACPDCRAYRQTMGNLLASFEALPEAPVPAGLSERIMAQVVAEKSPVPSKVVNARFGWRKAAPVAAAVLLLAVAVPLLISQLSDPSGSQGPGVAQHSKQAGSQPAMTETEKATLAGTASGNASADPAPVAEPAVNDATPVPAVSSTTTVAAAPVQTPPSHRGVPVVAARQPVAASEPVKPEDGMTLASALPVAGMDLQNAFDNQSEEDDYYDPVSSLVGF